MRNTFRLFTLVVTLSMLTACANFSSTSADNNNPLDAATVHANALVLDAHADIEIPGKEDRYAGADGKSKVEPSKMRAGGVDAVVMAVAVGPGPRDAAGYAQARKKADEELQAILDLTADPSDDVVLVRSADELEAAHANNQRALILGFQNARIIGTDVGGLDEFYAAGVRVFALTHMGHNDFADSSHQLTKTGWLN